MRYSTRFFICLSFLIYSSGYSQVGINTTTPTKDLDINGELRIRSLPINKTLSSVVLSDIDGNIYTNNVKLLIQAETTIASGPVNYSPSSTGNDTKNDINVGLSNTITIPAGTLITIIVNYSVPIGTTTFSEQVNGYAGIRFLKNGTEAPQGSRKFSFSDLYDPSSGSTGINMFSVSAMYIETIDNTASATDITITYTLNGYVEQIKTSAITQYRFNMWASSGANYNWGKASMSSQVYLN